MPRGKNLPCFLSRLQPTLLMSVCMPKLFLIYFPSNIKIYLSSCQTTFRLFSLILHIRGVVPLWRHRWDDWICEWFCNLHRKFKIFFKFRFSKNGLERRLLFPSEATSLPQLGQLLFLPDATQLIREQHEAQRIKVSFNPKQWMLSSQKDIKP